MKIIGKPPINPLLFYSGKFSGYGIWVLLLISLLSKPQLHLKDVAAIIVFGCAMFFIIISLINLGKSTRLGIPAEDTKLKTAGLYKISRNPMYVGFNLLSLAAILATWNFIVLILGVYSIFVYQQIILGEEKFLAGRFAQQYFEYKKKVRRYL